MGKKKKNNERPYLKFKSHKSVDPLWLHIPIKYMSNIKGNNKKDFCIIEFYGNKALCGWRNNWKCTVGKTFLCKIITKNQKMGIIYKDKFYPLGKSGWVW